MALRAIEIIEKTLGLRISHLDATANRVEQQFITRYRMAEKLLSGEVQMWAQQPVLFEGIRAAHEFMEECRPHYNDPDGRVINIGNACPEWWNKHQQYVIRIRLLSNVRDTLVEEIGADQPEKAA